MSALPQFLRAEAIEINVSTRGKMHEQLDDANKLRELQGDGSVIAISHFFSVKVIEEPTPEPPPQTRCSQWYFLAGEPGLDTMEFGTIILRNQFCDKGSRGMFNLLYCTWLKILIVVP